MEAKARIVLADDHEAVRAGVRAILGRESGWEISAEAVNGADAVAKTREFAPDLVILDVSMPEISGIEAARQIRRLVPSTKIVIFSMHDSSQMKEAAQNAGADAFVLKSAPAQELLQTIHRLLRPAN